MAQHKWHKEIKAWADGAEIEHRYVGHSDYFKGYKKWNIDEQHNFFTDGNWEYRIKSQPKRDVWVSAFVYKMIDGEIKLTDRFLDDGKFLGVTNIKLEQDDAGQ